jgi:hypothetical protein
VTNDKKTKRGIDSSPNTREKAEALLRQYNEDDVLSA